ncbi:unnamed protein product, partial [Rotaria sp. Silwood2]
MTDNSNIPTARVSNRNATSIPIFSSHRNVSGLDWAESSWIRWIHVAFWSWLNPILNIGYKRQLTENDLFELSSNDECGQLLKKLETVWEQNENKYEYINIWKLIAKTIWKECLIA